MIQNQSHCVFEGDETNAVVATSDFLNASKQNSKQNEWVNIGCYRFNATQQILQLGDKPIELSHREAEILRFLVENQNEVVEMKDFVGLMGR